MLGYQPFIGGASPLFADYIVFGALQWARIASPYRLLEHSDIVAQWFERCLDLQWRPRPHGGGGVAANRLRNATKRARLRRFARLIAALIEAKEQWPESAQQRRHLSGMTSGPDFSDDFRAGLVTLLRWRRDVRRFKPTALAEGTLERLLELASIAPSVGLSQPWRFVGGRERRAARRREGCFRALQCRGAGMLFGRARRALCPPEARRPERSALPVRGFRRPHNGTRPRAWPHDHAGDHRLFGGHGGAHSVAGGARRRHRHGLGLDPRCGRDGRRSSTRPRNGR